jgi:hypothetical protein
MDYDVFFARAPARLEENHNDRLIEKLADALVDVWQRLGLPTKSA